MSRNRILVEVVVHHTAASFACGIFPCQLFSDWAEISFSALVCCAVQCWVPAPVTTVKRCQEFRERRKITRNFSGEMCEKISRGLTDVDHAFQNCHNLTFRKIIHHQNHNQILNPGCKKFFLYLWYRIYANTLVRSDKLWNYLLNHRINGYYIY